MIGVMKTKQLDWTIPEKVTKYNPMKGTKQPANWARCCYSKIWLLGKSEYWNKKYRKSYIGLYK